MDVLFKMFMQTKINLQKQVQSIWHVRPQESKHQQFLSGEVNVLIKPSALWLYIVNDDKAAQQRVIGLGTGERGGAVPGINMGIE